MQFLYVKSLLRRVTYLPKSSQIKSAVHIRSEAASYSLEDEERLDNVMKAGSNKVLLHNIEEGAAL